MDTWLLIHNSIIFRRFSFIQINGSYNHHQRNVTTQLIIYVLNEKLKAYHIIKLLPVWGDLPRNTYWSKAIEQIEIHFKPIKKSVEFSFGFVFYTVRFFFTIYFFSIIPYVNKLIDTFLKILKLNWFHSFIEYVSNISKLHIIIIIIIITIIKIEF